MGHTTQVEANYPPMKLGIQISYKSLRCILPFLGDSVDSVTEVSPRTSDNLVVGGAGVDVSPSILELHRIEDVSPESTTSNGTPIQVRWL